MLTTYPAATYTPLPEAATQETITPVLVIYHTIVGSASGAISVMGRADWPGESHLVLPYQAQPVQLMPFDRRADCNWQVNSWITQHDIPMAHGVIVPRGTRCGAISIETEDDGTPHDTPWTPSQCEHLAKFSAWAYEHLHIPLDRPASPFHAGTGYHSLPGLNRLASWEPNAKPPYGTFTDSRGRVVNVYNPWTNTVGKACPGPARIAQFDSILDRARVLVRPPAPTPPPAVFPPPVLPINPTEDDPMKFIIAAAPERPEVLFCLSNLGVKKITGFDSPVTRDQTAAAVGAQRIEMSVTAFDWYLVEAAKNP
jgi:hypothetical protein